MGKNKRVAVTWGEEFVDQVRPLFEPMGLTFATWAHAQLILRLRDLGFHVVPSKPGRPGTTPPRPELDKLIEQELPPPVGNGPDLVGIGLAGAQGDGVATTLAGISRTPDELLPWNQPESGYDAAMGMLAPSPLDTTPTDADLEAARARREEARALVSQEPDGDVEPEPEAPAVPAAAEEELDDLMKDLEEKTAGDPF